MPTTYTPSFTDSVAVVAKQVLARGSTVRGTIDLTAKYGAWLHCGIGRGGTTALTNGVDVRIRRTIGSDGAGGRHPGDLTSLLSQTAAASSTMIGLDSSAGSATLNVASISGFAAGDILCIQDSGGGVTRLEFARISKTSALVLTLDEPLTYSHTLAQLDTVRNKADVFAPIWLPGGALCSVVFDYGDDSAGESVTVFATAQTYNSDVSS